MIVVKGELRVQPEDQEALAPALVTLIEATRAEPGCGAYLYMRDLDDPAVVHVFEQWDDEDALTAHMGAPHMAEFLASAAGVVRDATFTRYDATGSSKLF
jgi:quinol monooxygenase YgiN